MAFEPRWYQAEAQAAWWSYFSCRSGNPLIVMPTGSGKSPVLAQLLKSILTKFPRQRILVLTHVKELVEQDTKAILRNWPYAPVSIYSASVGKKDLSGKIVVASIQSLSRNLENIGDFNLIFVDEAHLVPAKSETQYRVVIDHIKKNNPKVKVTGLTATPYRLSGGHLLDCGIFTDICYDLTTPDAFARLVSEGFLCRLVNKRTLTKVNIEGVGMRGGDYIESELQMAVDDHSVTSAAVREMLSYGHDRKHILVFTAGVTHAHNVAAEFELRGCKTVVVHGGLTKAQREEALRQFTSGEARCCVNVNVLTTGFDYPLIDLIGVLRPSESVSLWVQILGRGLRVAEGKENCLVMDFTMNTIRLGPIDDPAVPPRMGKKKKNENKKKTTVAGKECEKCDQVSGMRAIVCKHCGHPFPLPEASDVLVSDMASEEDVMTDGKPIVKDFPVTMVNYALFQKPGRPDSIKVIYYSDLQVFTTWLNLEAPGAPKSLARAWWRGAADTTAPETCAEFLLRKNELAPPKLVKVWMRRPHPQVLNYDYGKGFGVSVHA